MTILYGKPPFELLVSTKNKISFAYFEYGSVLREANSLIFRTANKDYDIPVANLNALLLGIGTSISQPAIAEIARWGCNVSFVSGNGMGVHSSFTSSSSTTARLINKQAMIASSQSLRLACARKMYAVRWGVDNVPKNLSIPNLMRAEGLRVKKAYSVAARKAQIPNFVRKQQIDFASDDLINQFLSSANYVLYGLTNAVIVSLGLSPALGIIHHGHSRSFVFDIADLYKESLIIPMCFELASSGSHVSDVRKSMRERLIDIKLMPQIIDDIYSCLDLSLTKDEENSAQKSMLWANGEIIDNGGNSLWQD